MFFRRAQGSFLVMSCLFFVSCGGDPALVMKPRSTQQQGPSQREILIQAALDRLAGARYYEKLFSHLFWIQKTIYDPKISYDSGHPSVDFLGNWPLSYGTRVKKSLKEWRHDFFLKGLVASPFAERLIQFLVPRKKTLEWAEKIGTWVHDSMLVDYSGEDHKFFQLAKTFCQRRDRLEVIDFLHWVMSQETRNVQTWVRNIGLACDKLKNINELDFFKSQLHGSLWAIFEELGDQKRSFLEYVQDPVMVVAFRQAPMNRMEAQVVLTQFLKDLQIDPKKHPYIRAVSAVHADGTPQLLTSEWDLYQKKLKKAFSSLLEEFAAEAKIAWQDIKNQGGLFDPEAPRDPWSGTLLTVSDGVKPLVHFDRENGQKGCFRQMNLIELGALIDTSRQQ